MRFDSYLPTKIRFGAGRLNEVGSSVASLGERALVVTSRSAMDRLGYTSRVLDSLAKAGVTATVYRDLDVTPSTANVDAAADLARAFRAQVIVGLGGGSALDCAKAVAAVAPHSHPCVDFLYGRVAPTSDTLPIVAIPTTSGTASEANRAAIVTDLEGCHKDAIRGDDLFPRYAIVDPELTLALPARVTAETGFDALAHAVESYVSPKAQHWADCLAREAIQLIVKNLPLALAQPDHREARTNLSWASTAMGYNLSCVGTCLPHRLDKPLCASFPQIAHGQAVALFYPKWAGDSWRGSASRFAEIAVRLEPSLANLPAEEAAAKCGNAFRSFLKSIGLAVSIDALGVSLEAGKANELVKRVRGDLQTNPIGVTPADVAEYYQTLSSPHHRESTCL
jgi:alcohol dehydrogenase class IV